VQALGMTRVLIENPAAAGLSLLEIAGLMVKHGSGEYVVDRRHEHRS
jgi:hypothetical protein